MNFKLCSGIFAIIFLMGCGSSPKHTPPPPVVSIAVSSGSTQSAVINTAFGAPLVATVTTDGAPTSGVVVTFAAPSTGASGTFAGGVTTATTDANGVATSAVFTANATIGGPYTVTATVPEVATPANFTLTNTPIPYAFYLNGLSFISGGENYYALAGAITLDANGNVLAGVQDYNEGNKNYGATSPEPSGDTITGGVLVVDSTTGQGTLTLITNTSPAGTETLGVQFVNPKHALVIEFDGTATSSGSMDWQTQPGAPVSDGSYAFTFSGVDASFYSVVGGGVFTVSGTSMTGVVDVDDAGTVTTNSAFTGTISAPDSFGRGTISGTGLAAQLNYYIVGPEVIRIINADPDVNTSNSFLGSVFGQGPSSFSSASLGSSVFGIESNCFGFPYTTAGMFTAVPASGTFQGVADVDEYGAVYPDSSISGTYSIASNGYGNMTIAAGDLGDVSVLGIYMTDPNLNLNDPNNTTSGLGGALVADLDWGLNGAGVLIPQTDTAPTSYTGNYAFGAMTFYYNGFPGWEYDFVGQGSVASGALTGTGLISDTSGSFVNGYGAATLEATFAATATPDTQNVGRYTNPLAITVNGSETDLTTVIYQASGAQLLWMEESGQNIFLGWLQQQGSLTGLPVAAPRIAKAKAKAKK